jgi:G3E family GTPase
LGPVHDDVRSLVLQSDQLLDWMRLQAWLAELRATCGAALLRVKGIVHVVGEPAPLVLHGVHHLFHPALSAPGLAWPADRSALVLITKGLDDAPLRAGFAACVAG